MWDISRWDIIWAFIKHYGQKVLVLAVGIGIGYFISYLLEIV